MNRRLDPIRLLATDAISRYIFLLRLVGLLLAQCSFLFGTRIVFVLVRPWEIHVLVAARS
jgi:hypothetical protein